MSETSTSLTELARIASPSRLSAEDAASRRRTLDAIAAGLKPTLQRRGVGDLLGVVLTLSARSRRMVLPMVDIDVDVFSPEGHRALRMILPRRG
jgi:hypothetical protein